MKPYYEDATTQLFHGDCREILPALPKPDLIIADPPYEVAADSNGRGIFKGRDVHNGIVEHKLDSFVPSEWMPMLWAHCDHGYYWTSKNCLPDFTAWIAQNIESWDLLTMAKRNPIPSKNNKYLPDSELILFLRSSQRTCHWNNDQPYDFYRKVKWVDVHPPEHGHPCEKDVGLIGQLIRLSSAPGHLILDPFCGSGSTLVAAKNAGRRSVGVECCEEFCESAANRLSQGCLAIV